MVETMFRSGVPPHMGQSPLEGSDAGKARQESAPKNPAAKMTPHFILVPFRGAAP